MDTFVKELKSFHIFHIFIYLPQNTNNDKTRQLHKIKANESG